MDLGIIVKDLARDVVSIQLSGDLDAHTFDELENTLDALVERGVVKIVVDLSGISYISSAGVGVLFTSRMKVRELQGDIVLIQPTPAIYEVLSALGLTDVFVMVPNPASALAIFNVGGSQMLQA